MKSHQAYPLPFLAATLALATGCGGSSKAPTASMNMVGDTKNLAYLHSHALSGVIDPPPWAGYWWPYTTDGISDAATKYDAVNGTSATAWEYNNHGSGLPNALDWWGHCNGWAAAALLVPEPKGKKSASGLTFEIRDRKALLSEVFMEVTGDFLGTRVTDPDDTTSDAFLDLVPAQFYLAFTNLVGLQHRAVVIDRYTGWQVWNQPVVAYFHEPIRPEDYLGVAPGTTNVHRVNVTTEIWWSDDNVDPDVLTPSFNRDAPAGVFQSRTLRYELWLDGPPQFDAKGNLVSSGDVILTKDGTHVVGGQWKNAGLPLVNSYPDYLWIPNASAPSSGFKNPSIDDRWVLNYLR
jgi:hypothetical protein